MDECITQRDIFIQRIFIEYDEVGILNPVFQLLIR